MTLTQINRAGLDADALDRVFTIGASGSSAYTFQGEGLNGTVNNPTLYLTRGKTYRFENGSGGHPIRIQSTSGASGTAYNTGVTNNAGSGTVIVEVQHDAPDVLYYQCTSHAAMNGILYITGALADGGVTTAKLADDAVTAAKLADNAVVRANISDDAINADKITAGGVDTSALGSDSVTTVKILNGNVTTDKLADNAVTSQKIANEAVTLAKLPHGTSSNDGKFLRANNGADPSFETVSIPPSVGGANGVDFNDNVKARFGDGNDLELFHDATTSRIDDLTGSDIEIRAQDIRLQTNADVGAKSAINCNANAAVELYHNDTKQCETSANGLAFPSGKGIDFSADGSGTLKTLPNSFNAELLHDYENGTFTPNIQYDTGTSRYAGSQVSSAVGEYIRIGDLVNFGMKITLTSNQNHNENIHLYFGGLPYNGLHSSEQSSMMNGWGGWACPTNDSNSSYKVHYCFHGYTTVNLRFSQSSGTGGISGFYVWGFYRTAP